MALAEGDGKLRGARSRTGGMRERVRRADSAEQQTQPWPALGAVVVAKMK